MTTKYLVIGLDFMTPHANFRAANDHANRMAKANTPFGIWSCLCNEWAQEPNDSRIAAPTPAAPRVSLEKPAQPEGVALVAAVPVESNAVVMARAVEVVRGRRLDAEAIAARCACECHQCAVPEESDDEENRRALDAEQARAAAARKLAGE